MTNVKVSVIIPCFNEGETIRPLLSALSGQTYPLADMEVVIADAMSEDDTRKQIKRFQKENPGLTILLVDNPKRFIPAGLNAAMRAASGEIFLRMDAHAIPQPDYVERSVRALEEGKAENVGGVWDIRPRSEKLMARTIAAVASHPLAVGDARYRFAEKAAYVDTVPFGAFKRSLVDKIGGFDETLLTNEDYEFNVRIRNSGGRIWLDPAIRSTYYARESLSELSSQYWRYGFWKAQMLKRYPKTLRLRQALPPLFVLSLLGLSIGAYMHPLPALLVLIELGLYLLILLAVATQVAIKNKQPKFLYSVPLAIATMHFSWGAGFLRGLLTRNEVKTEEEQK